MSIVDIIVEAAVPWRNLRKANQTLRTRIENLKKAAEEGKMGDDLQLEHMKGYSTIRDVTKLDKLYAETLANKGTLETKLQAFLFSVAIGVTVLTSSLAFLYGSGFQAMPMWLKFTVILLLAAVILYMLLGGIFAIMTVGNEIAIFTLNAEAVAAAESEQNRTLAIATELNVLTNIVRQNFMSVSHHCILNAVYVVFVFFVLVGSRPLFVNSPSAPPAVSVNIEPLATNVSNLQSRLEANIAAQNLRDTNIIAEVLSLSARSTQDASNIATCVATLSGATGELRALSGRVVNLENDYRLITSNVTSHSAPLSKTSP